MPRLTDTQLVILSAAAARDDRNILPLPDTLKANKAALTRSIKSLLARALVTERLVKTDEPCWRETDEGRSGLAITPAGLEAIGATDRDTAASGSGEAARGAGRAGRKAASGSNPIPKADAVVSLLRRPDGAGIADLQAATGWQAHSVRAFLSGLRKKGLQIKRTKDASGKAVYSVQEANDVG